MSPLATQDNPLGLCGIEFVEFAGPDPEALHRLWTAFGFSRTSAARAGTLELYRQGDINLILHRKAQGHAQRFQLAHGPSIPGMAWRVRNAKSAVEAASKRGAEIVFDGDYVDAATGERVPAIRGIGDSLLYLVDGWNQANFYQRLGFEVHREPLLQAGHGFVNIDHLTNNVPQGTMQQWADFYKRVFGFTEVRYFDIRGARTGLVSYALRSPCGSFCIPINEGTEAKSQINEYLAEYKGPGVQHLAFSTNDIVHSLKALQGSPIETLTIDDDYYDEVFKRVPHVTEDHRELKRLNILVDGDAEGYLLQIFTKNLIGPIFIEIIQRKNHHAFGEGNFGALFRSIERDQQRRGVL